MLLHPPWSNKPAFYHRFPALRLLCFLVLGILLYEVGLRLPWYLLSSLFIAALLSAIFLSNTWHMTKGIATLLCVLLLGFASMQRADIRQAPTWFGYSIDTTRAYVLVIQKGVEQKKKTLKLPVKVIATIDDSIKQPTIGKALLYIYLKGLVHQYVVGDTLLVRGQWQAISPPANPYVLDYRKFLAHQNIYYQQFVAPNEVILLGRAAKQSFVYAAHKWCVQQLQRYIKDKKALGVMQAMIAGDESLLDPELRKAYAETGTIHIIAISGGHLVMLFWVVQFLFSRWKGRVGDVVKYTVGIGLIWLYVLIAGAPPSAVRSAVMFSILALGIYANRPYQALNSLFLSAFLLLALQPQWLFSVGFQLSVLAVCSIALFYPAIMAWWRPKSKVLKTIWSLCAASMAAEVMVAPLVLYYFHLFPVSFLLSNVLAWVFMSVAMIMGAVLLLLAPLQILADGLGWAIGYWLQAFHSMITAIAQLAPEFSKSIVVGWAMLIWLYVVVLLIAAGLYHYKHRLVWYGLACASGLVAYAAIEKYGLRQQQRLVVYSSKGNVHIEHVLGRNAYRFLSGVDTTNFEYKVRPSHLHWGIAKKATIPTQDTFWVMKGKTIALICTPNLLGSVGFHCDELIVGFRPKGVLFAEVVHTFKPKKIILTPAITSGYRSMWRDSCAKNGIAVHDVAKDGAYIVE